jgi:hypothetical protein
VGSGASLIAGALFLERVSNERIGRIVSDFGMLTLHHVN